MTEIAGLTASLARLPIGKGVHPMGTNSHRRETDGNHRAGALCPGQHEGLSE